MSFEADVARGPARRLRPGQRPRQRGRRHQTSISASRHRSAEGWAATLTSMPSAAPRLDPQIVQALPREHEATRPHAEIRRALVTLLVASSRLARAELRACSPARRCRAHSTHEARAAVAHPDPPTRRRRRFRASNTSTSSFAPPVSASDVGADSPSDTAVTRLRRAVMSANTNDLTLRGEALGAESSCSRSRRGALAGSRA